MQRRLVHIAVGSMIVLAAAGCRTMTGQSLGTNIDNTTTTAAVKAKLSADRLQNLTWVDVDTNAGTVYLSGTAATEAQKARAAEIAREVNGVQKVVNNIQVQRAGASGAASASPSSFQGRQTMTGEVTSIDHATGRLTLKTGEGDVMLQLPSAAVAGVKPGDRVTVQFGSQPGR